MNSDCPDQIGKGIVDSLHCSGRSDALTEVSVGLSMPFVVYGSRVYKYKARNNWKESWLSLEENGNLNWKRKDAFLPLASVKLTDVLNKIKIGDAWHESKEKPGNDFARPFFMVIPIRPSRPSVKFALLHGADLELWLAAFASVLKAKPLYKSIKAHNAINVAYKNGIEPEAVEKSLPYKELVQFYQNVWQGFLEARSGGVSSKSAFIEEREFYDMHQSQTHKALTEDAFQDLHLNVQSESPKSKPAENGHPKSENGHQTTQANGSHIVHSNGNAVQTSEKGPPKNVGSHDLLAGNARVEWFEIESTTKEPNRFATVIHIDHYPNQCSDKDGCNFIQGRVQVRL